MGYQVVNGTAIVPTRNIGEYYSVAIRMYTRRPCDKDDIAVYMKKFVGDFGGAFSFAESDPEFPGCPFVDFPAHVPVGKTRFSVADKQKRRKAGPASAASAPLDGTAVVEGTTSVEHSTVNDHELLRTDCLNAARSAAASQQGTASAGEALPRFSLNVENDWQMPETEDAKNMDHVEMFTRCMNSSFAFRMKKWMGKTE